MRRIVAVLSIALPIILLDQTSKYIVERSPFLKNASSMFVIGEIFHNYKNTIELAGGIVVLSIIGVVIFQGKHLTKMQNTGLICIGAGGISNGVDILRNGFIIDIIRIGNAYINIADMAIILGIACVIWKKREAGKRVQ